MEGEVCRDHKTRRLLKEYISENPGVSFKLLMNALNINKGTLSYHLGYLMRKRVIVQEKKGRERCYFSYIKKRFPYTGGRVNLNMEQERILEIVSINPGISVDSLRRRTGLKRSSFNYNLNKLKELRLIWRIKTRDGFGYEIVTEEKLRDRMFLVLVSKFTKGDIDRDTLMELVDELSSDDER
ncbi:MAG: MarR family transcriptional regulator [Thermoplasmatota archaeon]